MKDTATFSLIRADRGRGDGHWSDEDYDVYNGARRIGRIVMHPVAPEEQPWVWTITAHGRKASWADRGYAANLEDAMADLKAMWLRELLACPRVADVPTPSAASFIVKCLHCNAQVWVAVDSPNMVRRMCLQCVEE